MKKILILLFIILSTGSAFAKNVQVECLTSISSETEEITFKAKILKDVEFKSGITFAKNEYAADKYA